MTAIPRAASVRKLQRGLYRAAKSNGARKFYSLYDKVWRQDVLWQAWEEVKANHGAPGLDAQSIEAIVASGEATFITTLGQQLREKTYRPQPVRRVYIPKPKGGQRPLGIPSVADRVVQTAVRLVLEPIFEADFQDCSYGYRPRRSARACSTVIRDTLYQGVHSVVEVDLTSYFDSVPHEKLMVLVRERIADGSVLRLLWVWLRAGYRDVDGAHRPTPQGVPQGGPLSPLLSNVYLNLLDRLWKRRGYAEKLGATLYRYADGMPEQTLDARVKVPPPQLPVQGSSSEAALAGDRRGQVPRHRPQKVAAERQAAAQANPHVSLVIRTCGGRPTRLLGKAATSREVMGTCTAMAPPGCQGRHVATVQESKSGRSGRTTEQVAPVLGAYKADRRSGVGVRPEVGGARIVRWTARWSGGLKSLRRPDEGRCIQKRG